MSPLLLAGSLAQLADAATLRFDHEANPVVLGLGPQAYLAKIALILAVVLLSNSLPRLRGRFPILRRWAAYSLASLLLVVGLVGAISNLAA